MRVHTIQDLRTGIKVPNGREVDVLIQLPGYSCPTRQERTLQLMARFRLSQLMPPSQRRDYLHRTNPESFHD
jgi:hypothetical protein